MPAMPDPSSDATPPRQGRREVGVFAAYREAWSVLKERFGILLGLLLVMIAANAPPSIYSSLYGADPSGVVAIAQLATEYVISTAYGIFIAAPIAYGLFYAYLRAARDEAPQLEDLFEGFRTYPATVGAALLTAVLITAGLILFIIPGIVASVRLSFVPFLVTDERLGALEAVQESWRRTSGHGWSIFGLILVAIPVLIGGLLLFIVGVIPAIMLVYLAITCYYRGVTDHTPAPATEPTPPSTPGSPPTTEPAAGARVQTGTSGTEESSRDPPR